MKKNIIIAMAALAAFSWIFGSAADNKTITIKGSTTVLPIAQSCAESFMAKYQDINVSVQGGGSGVGIASVIDGTADIGDASRAIKEKEVNIAREKGVDCYENVVAWDGIAVIVNSKNPVKALSLEQIKAIYTGKISNWKDLGGKKGPIVVVSRDSSSGTFEAFNEMALEKEKVRPDALMNASNRSVASTVANTPGAIGYVGLGYLSEEVKALVVNEVEADEANVLNGSYPLARKLYMYTKGKPTGPIAAFIEFVLSKDGQKLVKKEGFVPVK